MIKGIIFDYGGTLDTGGHHWGKVIWHAYERVGVPVEETLFREAYVHGERTLAKTPIITPSHTFRETLSEKLKIQLDYIARKLASEPSLMPETGDGEHKPFRPEDWHGAILDRLYRNTKAETERSRSALCTMLGRFPMVLVSNFYGNIATVLNEFGFDRMFKNIVESAVVGVRKPDPQIFTLGVEALGLNADEVVVVGDSYDKDIVAAKRAGCHTIWIKGEGWTDAEETDDFDSSAADIIITNIGEVESAIEDIELR